MNWAGPSPVAGQSSRGDQQRPLGSVIDAHVGNRRPYLQRRCLLRNNANGLEETERPRQELEARLQGLGPPRVFDQNRQRKGKGHPLKVNLID